MAHLGEQFHRLRRITLALQEADLPQTLRYLAVHLKLLIDILRLMG
jgi:hypothetical protein